MNYSKKIMHHVKIIINRCISLIYVVQCLYASKLPTATTAIATASSQRDQACSTGESVGCPKPQTGHSLLEFKHLNIFYIFEMF